MPFGFIKKIFEKLRTNENDKTVDEDARKHQEDVEEITLRSMKQINNTEIPRYERNLRSYETSDFDSNYNDITLENLENIDHIEKQKMIKIFDDNNETCQVEKNKNISNNDLWDSDELMDNDTPLYKNSFKEDNIKETEIIMTQQNTTDEATSNDLSEKMNPKRKRITNNTLKKMDIYKDLGIEAIEIFYRTTKGTERASKAMWFDMWNKYKNLTKSNMKFKTFKNYMSYTKNIRKSREINLKHNCNSENAKIQSENQSQNNNIKIENSNEVINMQIDQEDLTQIDKNENKNPLNKSKSINKKNTTLLEKRKLQHIYSKRNIRVNNDQKIKKEISDIFKNTMIMFRERKIESKKTHKIPDEKVDWTLIHKINEIIDKEYLYEGISYENLIDVLYTSQITYETLKKNNRRSMSYELKLRGIIKEKEEILSRLKIKNMKFNNKNTYDETIHSCYGKISSPQKLQEVKHTIESEIKVYKKRLDIHISKKEIKRINYMFQLNRAAFLREINNDKVNKFKDVEVSDGKEITRKWVNKWETINSDNYDLLINEISLKENIDERNINELEIRNEVLLLIKKLPLWKAAGPDNIYNFWIKNLTSTHKHIQDILVKFIANPDIIPNSFFKGKTYMIIKNKALKYSYENVRPITCLNGLYKLYTKLMKNNLWKFVNENEILSISQAGAIPNIQGAKEQFMINKSIVNKLNNECYSAYVDIKKAYDSLNQNYLIALLKRFNAPIHVIKFLETAMPKWETEIFISGKKYGISKFNNGLIQGDSLSPLLFVLALEPISRKLKESIYPTVVMNTGISQINLNHLLFIDDMKIYAHTKEEVIDTLTATKSMLKFINLEVNENKTKISWNNSENLNNYNENEDEINDNVNKYLGIREFENLVDVSNYESIENKILKRIEKLCKTRLSARNLIIAINEYGISMMNYYVGLIKFEEKWLNDLDQKIRLILSKYKVHYKDACKYRLYFSRRQNGRGLKSIYLQTEMVLFNLGEYLNENNTIRKKIILQEIKKSGESRILYTKESCQTRYNCQINNTKELTRAQDKWLLDSMKKKILHGSIYRHMEKTGLKITNNTEWLRFGSHSPQNEAYGFLIQDRHLAEFTRGKNCKFCAKALEGVEHYATRCGHLLHSLYTKRHNDILKSVHFAISRKMGITDNSKIKLHKLKKILSTDEYEIIVDKPCITDTEIQHKKPDIIINDKIDKKTFIIEVGITSFENLRKTEVEKVMKYRTLGAELGKMNGSQVFIIPFVMTWDGFMTEFGADYMRVLGIDDVIKSYIQFLSISATGEIMKAQEENFIMEDKSTERKKFD
ncbi:LINE-1 reverse transcriptase like protein [Dictyocoela muelleri]|nr:LINE-1 reverse transcriptase like protein [Dictyocoela muelleri]